MIIIDRENKKIEVNVPNATEAIIKYGNQTEELFLNGGYGFVTGLDIQNVGTIIVKAVTVLEEQSDIIE